MFAVSSADVGGVRTLMSRSPLTWLTLLLAMWCAACGSENPFGGSDETDAVSSSPSVERLSGPSFGLVQQDGGYRLDVHEQTGVGGQAIAFDVTKNGKRLDSDDIGEIDVFAVGDGVSWFVHEQIDDWSNGMNVMGTGPVRVVVRFDDSGDEVMLGADVTVHEESDFGGGLFNPTQTDLVQGSGVLVERNGWTFDVMGTWDAPSFHGNVSWLTVVRRSDLAVTYDTFVRRGDGLYGFEPVLPGAGDYWAILEVAGAPAFSFAVSVDAAGQIVPPPERDVLDAVATFVEAVHANDAATVRAMTSSECQPMLSSTLEDDLRLDSGERVWLTSAVATIDGDVATVEYVTIEGDYRPGTAPYWLSRHDTWVLEGGNWLRDTCDTGSIW